jgi:hypothetical protein
MPLKKAPTLGQLMELLKRADVVGVGEGFWQEVLQKETNYPALAAEALKLRKTVEGHAAGCRSRQALGLSGLWGLFMPRIGQHRGGRGKDQTSAFAR